MTSRGGLGSGALAPFPLHATTLHNRPWVRALVMSSLMLLGLSQAFCCVVLVTAKNTELVSTSWHAGGGSFSLRPFVPPDPAGNPPVGKLLAPSAFLWWIQVRVTLLLARAWQDKPTYRLWSLPNLARPRISMGYYSLAPRTRRRLPHSSLRATSGNRFSCF